MTFRWFRWHNIALFWLNVEITLFLWLRLKSTVKSCCTRKRDGLCDSNYKTQVMLSWAWDASVVTAECSTQSSVTPSVAWPQRWTVRVTMSRHSWKNQALVPPQPRRWFSSAMQIQDLDNYKCSAKCFSHAQRQVHLANNHKLLLLDLSAANSKLSSTKSGQWQL